MWVEIDPLQIEVNTRPLSINDVTDIIMNCEIVQDYEGVFLFSKSNIRV